MDLNSNHLDYIKINLVICLQYEHHSLIDFHEIHTNCICMISS